MENMNFKEFLEVFGYDPSRPKKGFFGNLFKSKEAKIDDLNRARQARTALRDSRKEPIKPNDPSPTATPEELSKHQSDMEEFQKNHDLWQKRQGANERYNKKLQDRQQQKQTGGNTGTGASSGGGTTITFTKAGDAEPSQAIPVQQAGLFVVRNMLGNDDYYFVDDGRQKDWAQIKDSKWLMQQVDMAKYIMAQQMQQQMGIGRGGW